MFLEGNTGALTLMSVWAGFSDVSTNVPLLRLLQKIRGGEDFSKTSAKQLGRARSGDRTSLSQVCLEEETGNRQWWNSEPTHRDIVTAQDPSGVPTAQVGEVKL
jgi:hypothetical protein